MNLDLEYRLGGNAKTSGVILGKYQGTHTVLGATKSRPQEGRWTGRTKKDNKRENFIVEEIIE